MDVYHNAPKATDVPSFGIETSENITAFQHRAVESLKLRLLLHDLRTMTPQFATEPVRRADMSLRARHPSDRIPPDASDKETPNPQRTPEHATRLPVRKSPSSYHYYSRRLYSLPAPHDMIRTDSAIAIINFPALIKQIHN